MSATPVKKEPNEVPPDDEGQTEIIKIKREKIDPEIEEKINLLQFGNENKEDVNDRKPVIGQNGDIVSDSTLNGLENRLNEGDSADEDASNESFGPEEKKSIGPVKSSNEILAELFRVFNAAPPEELLNDENLLKKAKHKKHKKVKKKKKKRSKSDDEESGSESSASSQNSKDDDTKSKRKHKKHKHKSDKTKDKSKDKVRKKEKSRDRERSKDRERKRSPLDVKQEPPEIKTEKESSTKHRKRHADEDNADIPKKSSRPTEASSHQRHREKTREHDKVQNSFYNGFRGDDHDHKDHRNRQTSKDRKNDSSSQKEVRIKKEPIDQTPNEAENRNRVQSKDDGHISEISLSDEETYLKERNSIDIKRRRFGHSDSRHESRYKSHNSFYASAERSRSRDRGYRSRHRSRSRSRSRDLGIDKKRLLEIARKNAISMFKRGNLPGCAEMTEEVKDKVLLKMRYGGRTVQDLTEFCKKLSNGENLNDISDLSSAEDSDVDKSGNAKAFNHPFVIKEREPIVMHIRGSAPIVPKKNENQTKAITMQFPVSSGQQHRVTENWVPVEPKESLAPLPALPAATQSTNIFKAAAVKSVTKNIFEKPVPMQAQQEPAFKSLNPPTTCPIAAPPNTLAQPPAIVTAPPPEIPTPVLPATVVEPNIAVPPPFVPDVPVPSAASNDSVFPNAAASNLDVSSIISKRLNAMRRLQDNPMDPEALKMMYNSQREMSSWASSKHLPGQFTGSTGVNVLSARELNSGPQIWARRDQLTSTQPMTGGMGMQLLKKMGWKPGEGLGREKTGSLQPLLLDVKLDKRGLVSHEDNGYHANRPNPPKKRRGANEAQAQQNLQDKHPVSLLNELTSKRKWTPPLYTLVNEGGPSHNKIFLFSVSINGQTFTPDQGSNTKKDAKVIAARHCLKQMGIIQ